ncbi:MAG: 50S ribosomal protein L4 [Defluviitaleaceae bacterium]|nr:50S ribosomal protein L4 [Defluviitaleaceae bacterium]
MASVQMYNMNGEAVGSLELSDAVFGVSVNEHVVHQAVVQYLANQRQGTQSALTRAEVRGGGRKPWRQKGLGRARQGSTRSPQWRGGGVIFAPKPRDYSFKLNKKVKRLALKSALSSRVSESKLIILDEMRMSEVKTKTMQKVVDALKLGKAMFVLEGDGDDVRRNVVLSARNIPSIKTSAVNNINVYDILKYDTLVLTKDAALKLQEVYS